MTSKNLLPNELKSWDDLTEEAKKIKKTKLKSPNITDDKFTLNSCGITLDFSRQLLNTKIIDKLFLLTNEIELKQKINDFFRGKLKYSNPTISPLHMALRGCKINKPTWDHQKNLLIKKELDRFLNFAEELRNSKVKGWKNEVIKNIVVLGLGGSILGPKFVTNALKNTPDSSKIKIFFISNPDGKYLNCCLKGLNPGETIFFVQSKSYNTPEIKILENYAHIWLKDSGCPEKDVKAHFVVITANDHDSKLKNYMTKYSFKTWEWIGGRFSVWSAMGLSLAVSIGKRDFLNFLDGAREMDHHFLNEKFNTNLPVLSALISAWNSNFLGFPSHLISTYSSDLDLLVPYLQQLDMESLGKNRHVNGSVCKIDTGQIIWGGPGIEGQHAYFQLLHQGKQVVPVSFYGVKTDKKDDEQSNFANRSLISQADALFHGDFQNNFLGKRPSNIFWLDNISPKVLGALLSMHEHRIFVLSCIWDINPFDQPGVELGKKLLKNQ